MIHKRLYEILYTFRKIHVRFESDFYQYVTVMEFVTGFIDSPAFKPWDIGDHVSPRLAHSVGNIDNFTLTNELLHQAAFRDGLGNSLHSPDYMVSVLSQLVQKKCKNLSLYPYF